MRSLGIWEPLAVKRQTVSTAVESATLLLRIDDIVSGISKKGPPGERGCVCLSLFGFCCRFGAGVLRIVRCAASYSARIPLHHVEEHTAACAHAWCIGYLINSSTDLLSRLPSRKYIVVACVCTSVMVTMTSCTISFAAHIDMLCCLLCRCRWRCAQWRAGGRPRGSGLRGDAAGVSRGSGKHGLQQARERERCLNNRRTGRGVSARGGA